MPLYAVGWSLEKEEELVDLVKPHPELYNLTNTNRKNISARFTWQEIANKLGKPVEECKRRWKSLRYRFLKHGPVGTVHERRLPIHEKLQFLKEVTAEDPSVDLESYDNIQDIMVEGESSKDGTVGAEQVITDNQEYYEIEIVDEASPIQPVPNRPVIKLLPSGSIKSEPPKKIVKRVGRKKSVPIPPNLTPVKILPKPLIPMREPKLVRCIETPKTLEQRSQTLDKLIEKVLKENTNEIDVFFRSMAASVKKLQPNLIPKVKMEVCNVIAKYEMQSFDRTS